MRSKRKILIVTNSLKLRQDIFRYLNDQQTFSVSPVEIFLKHTSSFTNIYKEIDFLIIELNHDKGLLNFNKKIQLIQYHLQNLKTIIVIAKRNPFSLSKLENNLIMGVSPEDAGTSLRKIIVRE